MIGSDFIRLYMHFCIKRSKNDLTLVIYSIEVCVNMILNVKPRVICVSFVPLLLEGKRQDIDPS